MTTITLHVRQKQTVGDLQPLWHRLFLASDTWKRVFATAGSFRSPFKQVADRMSETPALRACTVEN